MLEIMANCSEPRIQSKLGPATKSASEHLLEGGFYNEAIILAWHQIRDAVFIRLQEEGEAYVSTTDALLKILSLTGSQRSRGEILFVHSIATLAGWPPRLEIKKQEAQDVLRMTDQLLREICK